MDRLPKLRPDVAIESFEAQGETVVSVFDTIGLRDETWSIHPDILPLIPLFDGLHTPEELRQECVRLCDGDPVTLDEAMSVVQDLDDLLVLDTEHYRAEKQAAVDTFAGLAVRPPALAGRAYPSDASELEALLDEILAEAPPEIEIPESFRALVAPHIALEHGRSAYGAAYRALQGRQLERVIVLGTSHYIGSFADALFSLTDKDYATPLGCFPTDREAVSRLRKAGDHTAASTDLAHIKEHSIEFQLLFVHHLLAEVPVVPILVGPFLKHLERVSKPSEIPGVGAFLAELRALMQGDTLLVAGVDLSHVGLKFGHAQSADSQREAFVRHDRALVDALLAGSVTQFWDEIRRLGNRFHVCGSSALACLLEVVGEVDGTLLVYDVWDEVKTGSAVSFVAAVL